jgi:hypothetical protein
MTNMSGDTTGTVRSGVTGQTVRLPVRGKRVRWTAGLVGMFMDHIAATGNIAAAARLIGIHPAQCYHRLRTDTGFSEAWQAAIVAGHQTVEIGLIGHVLSGGKAEADADAPPFDWERGLRLLTLADRRQSGGVRQGKPPRQLATREETDALILKRLTALAARKAREADRA